MKDQNKIVAPGDILIKDLILESSNGNSITLKNIFTECVIFEDITQNFLSGTLIMTDAQNLMRHLPITGQEFLYIDFQTPGTDKSVRKKFQICGITNVLTTSEKTQIYKILFVSKEALIASQTKISKSFVNTPFSDIIYSLYKEIIDISSPKEIYIEPTYGNKTVTLPYFNPHKIINDIARYARPKYDPKRANYVFFETLDGFNFCPIDYRLFYKSFEPEYEQFIANINYSGKNYDTELRRITSCEIERTPNTLTNINSGVYSGLLTTYDFTKKKITNTFSNYFNQFSSIDHLEKNPILQRKTPHDYSNSYGSFFDFRSKQSFMYDNQESYNDIEEVFYSRIHQINGLNSYVLNITVPGDHRRRVGEIIKLNYTAREKLDNLINTNDPYLSGRYIIMKITHMIRPDNYEMTMQIAKDSVQQPIPDISVFGVKND